MLNDLKSLFEVANQAFLHRDLSNILNGVSERTLCGGLMLSLRKAFDESIYKSYHVDIEYNRNRGGDLKTIFNGGPAPISICCDLIVHSRGENIAQDNLIAIEMKRSTHRRAEKEKDKLRLECLTKDDFDGLWSFDGTTLPEHVCRYVLGIYYEINVRRRQIGLIYYVKGQVHGNALIRF